MCEEEGKESHTVVAKRPKKNGAGLQHYFLMTPALLPVSPYPTSW